ncbi:MAG: hypothetical protein JSS09_00400 [Verrucomicrobia bacterium]|nr:hypothetical protein [Verrucomicrobiota bacterium]
MNIRHGLAITLSGVLWMAIGVFLLLKGFSHLLHSSPGQEPALLPYIGSFVKDPEQGSLVLVSLGLLIGFIKGRVVLAKTAARVIAKILSLPNPCSFSSIYGPSYLLLLGSMVCLGMLIRWLPIAYDVKGVVDIAIGSALTNGSAFYFRHFADAKRKNLQKP